MKKLWRLLRQNNDVPAGENMSRPCAVSKTVSRFDRGLYEVKPYPNPLNIVTPKTPTR